MHELAAAVGPAHLTWQRAKRIEQQAERDPESLLEGRVHQQLHPSRSSPYSRPSFSAEEAPHDRTFCTGQETLTPRVFGLNRNRSMLRSFRSRPSLCSTPVSYISTVLLMHLPDLCDGLLLRRRKAELTRALTTSIESSYLHPNDCAAESACFSCRDTWSSETCCSTYNTVSDDLEANPSRLWQTNPIASL